MTFRKGRYRLAEVGKRFPTPHHWIVDLSYVTIGVSSNTDQLPGGQYIGHKAATFEEVAQCDYRINLHERVDLMPQERDWLDLNASNTFRAQRFRAGFYVTHHFGEPAYLFDYGRDVCVVGKTLDKLIWSFFVKYFLTVEAEARDALHLKAAAIEIDGKGVLLIGRGSGGKTVFAAEACRRGAAFVGNTHCVVTADQRAVGVKSPLRVRNDTIFSTMIDRLQAKPHFAADEFTLNVEDVFPVLKLSTTVDVVLILDYRGANRHAIEELPIDDFFRFAMIFAFPVITYGIKDDVLSWLHGDHIAFIECIRSMQNRLIKLLSHTKRYYVSVDITDDRNWDSIRRLVVH